MTSCDVELNVLFVHLYKIMTFNLLIGQKQGRPSQFTTKFNFDIIKINLHPKIPPRVTSCPSRVTLGLKCGTLGKEDETLGLQRPKIFPLRANCLINYLQRWNPIFGWHLGPPRANVQVRGAWKPWIYVLQSASKGNILFSIGASLQSLSCPLVGVSTSISELWALWRSELIIPSCLHVHYERSYKDNKYALQGFIIHKDHSM